MASSKCGCKGIRSCAICDKIKRIPETNCINELSFILCTACSRASFGHHTCNTMDSSSFSFGDVFVIPEFVTEKEEQFLLGEIDASSWALSQSGRRKQDFGPKVNFKRQRVNPARFTGLPAYSKFLVDRINEWIRTNDSSNFSPFDAVELCNLEYTPDRGACIVPHLDDVWLWGDRLITLNLCSPTVLSFTLPTDPVTNKDVGREYQRIESVLASMNGGTSKFCVRVPLDRRSLVIVAGPARYVWLHEIRQTDISARRIAMTFRELSAPFVPLNDPSELLTDNQALGKRILELAQSFSGKVCIS